MTHEQAAAARERAGAYARFLEAAHRPAHARRTASTHAAFLLPLLEPGLRVLDAGCGPGSITLGLAAAVAPGRVTGIDIDPRAVAAATAAALADRCANVTFAEATVYALPFSGASFDVVFAHALFQHLEEPAAALAEFRRVLAPGGVAALADADYDGSLVWPEPPALHRAIEIQRALRERTGGDPCVGRRLGTLLADAGFVDVAVGATAWTDGTPEAAQLTAESSARYFEAPAFQSRALRLGLASPGEFAPAAEAWREWARAPGACWARFWLHATARKPG